MNKNFAMAIASIVAFLLVFLSPMFATSASAQPLPSVPTVNVSPNFAGQWTLGFSSGRMTDTRNGYQSFQYTEFVVNMTGGGGESDGSMSYSGNVIGSSGSSVNIFTNSSAQKYVEMYVYIPEPSLGSGNQYFLQISIRMFISPDGNYLNGTMVASFYDSLNSNGNSTPTILYHSDVSMSRYGARG